MAMPNVLAAAAFDRAAHRRRDADWLAARLDDPETRMVAVAGTDVPVTAGDLPVAALLPLRALAALDPVPPPVFLGLDDLGAVWAVDVADVPREEVGTVLGPGRLAALREVGALVSQGDGGLLAYASAMVGWHRRHRFCAVCGNSSQPEEGGHLRACPVCGAKHFPRTDPVVIMLVHDGDRCLLGRQAIWPPGRYSALAGYVEPGESLEDAVVREVAEEAGLGVGDVRYQSSQPWPFPSSLMLGFTAVLEGGELALLDDELEDARWFHRHELRAAVSANDVLLPPPVAIARRLIGDWLDAG